MSVLCHSHLIYSFFLDFKKEEENPSSVSRPRKPLHGLTIRLTDDPSVAVMIRQPRCSERSGMLSTPPAGARDCRVERPKRRGFLRLRGCRCVPPYIIFARARDWAPQTEPAAWWQWPAHCGIGEPRLLLVRNSPAQTRDTCPAVAFANERRVVLSEKGRPEEGRSR